VQQVPIAAKLILSLKEASALSGISRDYLVEAIKKRKLKARLDEIGRGYRIKRADLEDYIKKL
jgi:excisionase family DNA binding protein